MFKTTRLIFALFISSLIFSCTRSFEENSNVSLSFANINQVGAMSCLTTCLKSIIIKIEGDGFDKIVTKLNSDNILDMSEIATTDFTYNLPPGTDRKFKVVAIYIMGGKHILAYGESSIDLPDTTPKTVEITMVNQGEIHGGSLVGRYITNFSAATGDSGPTGSVDMILTYNSDPDFDILIAQSQILNGWFDFMASENLEMTYKVSGTGEMLFEKKSLNILRPLSGVTPENHVGRLVRPESFYRFNSSTWNFEKEKHDILYGFFGEPTYLSNKHVCFEYASLHSFSNLRSADNSTALTYSADTVSDLYRIGGTTTNDAVNCPGYETADRYKENKIYISKEQIDGNGNDTAKGFGNAFSYIATTVPSLSVKKYHYSNGTFSLKTLPGLFGPTSASLFNDIKLYKKSGATNGGFDDLQCTQEWLDTNGFSPVIASTALSSDTTTFQITGALLSSDGTIACPTKLDESEQPQLQTHGGFYLGALEYSYLSGPASAHITTAPGPGYVYVSITNTGTKTANSLAGTLPGGTIVFFNGSFIAAGDCSVSLAPGATCQVKLQATGTDSVNLMISYDSGFLNIPINSAPP